MTETCFVCGRPARWPDGTGEMLCWQHSQQNRYLARASNNRWVNWIDADLVHERRLALFHGPARASIILAGHDPEANADLAAWRRLG